MYAIEDCRTSALGCHADRCDNCGHIEVSYNSCRDRHCPKCQGSRRHKWVESRLNDLLPVPYYHIVFTLPDAIFPMCLFNQKIIYKLLFDASSETLLTFGRDEKWIGSEPGFFGILHTWGQTICMHPHIHFIMPGGGIDSNRRWVPAKHKDKFLFPSRAMSKVFRAKFIAGLKQAYKNDLLTFPGELAKSQSKEGFLSWIYALCAKDWVVFTKAPFANPRQVVEYVGRYTHRVAISNHRIRSIENGRIVFTYKDYADEDKVKEMSLSAHEFIRRFLYHVLPAGFHKIRHYGFLANGRRAKLRQITEYLRSFPDPDDALNPQSSDEDTSVVICPVCQSGKMEFISSIPYLPAKPGFTELIQALNLSFSFNQTKLPLPVV